MRVNKVTRNKWQNIYLNHWLKFMLIFFPTAKKYFCARQYDTCISYIKEMLPVFHLDVVYILVQGQMFVAAGTVGHCIVANQPIILLLCNLPFCYTSENTLAFQYLFIHFITMMLRCLLKYQSLFKEIKMFIYDGCQVAN